MMRFITTLQHTWPVAGLLVSASVAAQPAPPPPEGQRRPPPPEALAACKALKAGDACSFTSPQGAEKGDCFAPEGKPLACRPSRRPPPDGGQPIQPKK